MNIKYGISKFYSQIDERVPVPAGNNSTTTPSRNLINFEFSTVNIDGFVRIFNWFIIIWSIYLVFILIADFYFYYKKASDKNISREDMGQKSLNSSGNIWWRYLPLYVLFLVYWSQTGMIKFAFGIVFVFSSFVKMYFDILMIIPISSYFPWFKSFNEKLELLLRLGKTK